MPPKPTIFVVDDDAAVRQSLRVLLEVNGYAVQTFDSAEAFLAQLPDAESGCLLLDVRMPGMSGLDLQRELTRRAVDLPVVVITGHGDVPMAVAALKAGAVDFLEKPFDSDALLASLRDALRRAPPIPAAVSGELTARMNQLTQREREVMDLVVTGLPNKMIAHRLAIAIRTVEIHRARVMEKTGARNLAELVRIALQLEGGRLQ
jgi:two-component system response regulator FixJ